ncbi:MAG: hypothetical protein RDU25_00040 [Patescibacteria group bacterium]|nr:hypothetical protein [Patescibacteria group bacterium]
MEEKRDCTVSQTFFPTRAVGVAKIWNEDLARAARDLTMSDPCGEMLASDA